MSRIDAIVATQVGESTRPRQTAQDGRLQTQQASLDNARKAAAGTAAEVGADDLQAAAARMKQVVELASGRRLNFKLHAESDDLVVEISDQDTGEMIKQIPSLEMLRLHARIDEVVGMMVDKTA